MNEQLRLELFRYVQRELEDGNATQTEVIADFAAHHSLQLDECQQEYAKESAEQAKLKIRFEKLLEEGKKLSPQKAKDLKSKVSPSERAFESWEAEIIETADRILNMNRTSICKYVESHLPHRTWKAYIAYLHRADIKKQQEREAINIESAQKLKVEDQVSLNKVYKPGEVVEVAIVKLHDFGAIAVTSSNRKGLIHISEIADEFVDDASKYFYIGQKIQAQVISDKDGKISFSTRRIKSVSKEQAKIVKEESFINRVQASPHRIEKQRKLLQSVSVNPFVIEDVVPKSISNMLKEEIGGALPVGDDLVLNIDNVIANLQQTLDVLKETREKLVTKELQLSKLATLKETLQSIL